MFGMTVILAIANQKGGVGKTTTAVNTSAVLAQIGKRVLLVDLDPQGNATMGSGVDKQSLDETVYHVLIGEKDIVSSIAQSTCGYDVLPSNRDLIGAELDLVSMKRREFRLADALTDVKNKYDFIFIDCPPSLSLLTLNGLCAARGILIPMQCEYFALEGLSDLINSVRRVHANLNTNLDTVGLLRVMYDPRATLSQQVSNQLKTYFGKKVFSTIIPRNVRLAEAPSYGLPAVMYDKASRGSKAYVEFAEELLGRVTTNSIDRSLVE
tara:strand:- start:30806 stop:31606 length:801 start_codon:yes stop_codon:yes gene_type:complete